MTEASLSSQRLISLCPTARICTKGTRAELCSDHLSFSRLPRILCSLLLRSLFTRSMQIFLLITLAAAVTAKLGSSRAPRSIHKRMGLTNLHFDQTKTSDLKATTGNFAHALTGKVWQLGTVQGTISHNWTAGQLTGRYHTEIAENAAKAIGHWTFDDKVSLRDRNEFTCHVADLCSLTYLSSEQAVTGTANLHL